MEIITEGIFNFKKEIKWAIITDLLKALLIAIRSI